MRHLISVMLVLLLFATAGQGQQGMQEGVLNVLSFDQPTQPYQAAELFENTPDSLLEHPEFGEIPFNSQCTDCFELLGKRTIDSRLYYKKGTGGQIFYKQQSYGPLHYKDKQGSWRTIDHRLQPVAGVPGLYEAPHQPIPTTINLVKDYTAMVLEDGGTFRFNDNTTCFVLDESGNEIQHFGHIGNPVHTAGHDGVVQYNAWPGIDRQLFVHRGEIKTEYVLQDRLDHLPDQGWLVFEEILSFKAGLQLSRVKGGIPLQQGRWYGDYELTGKHGRLAKIGKPTLYDASPNPETPEGWPVCYELVQNGGQWKMRLLVDLEYLQSPKRVYPVVIDPIVLGSNTYNTGYMGFKFDPVCFDSDDYCDYQMTVIVPGNSTVTSAWFDAQYNSKNGGCGMGTLCRKKDAAFSMEGPCGSSPRPGGFWTCDSSNIISTIPGLCYGDSIATFFRHLVLCDSVPPSCPDHVLDFEMRTYHCSCVLPGCDTACHIMRTGTWRVTVEARTLEGFVLKDETICPGEEIELRAIGNWGVPPYTYQWQPSGKTTDRITESPLNSGTYYCTITDQCGITVVDSAHITVRGPPALSLSKTDALCSGGSDGEATAVASGTQGPYQYEWNTDPPQTTSTADSLRPGWYTVTATDAFGCTTVDSIEVGYVNLMEITPTVTDVSCHGLEDGRINLNAQGTAPFTYLWHDGHVGDDRNDLGAGIYRVTATDDMGCVDTISITINEPAPIAVDAGQDQSILQGQVASLQGTVVPSGTYAYEWRPPGSLSAPSSLVTDATPDSTTLYVLRVTSSANPDCWQEDSMTVFVLPQTQLFVPTAFSPNGDGHNDVFRPKGDAEIESMRVYNRWGILMYEGATGWDGSFQGQPQPVGTYIYVIQIAEPLSEEPTQLQGNVTLLR